MVEFEERKITIATHSGKGLCAKNESVAREPKGLLWVMSVASTAFRAWLLYPNKRSKEPTTRGFDVAQLAVLPNFPASDLSSA
jgi:hypothetical protein